MGDTQSAEQPPPEDEKAVADPTAPQAPQQADDPGDDDGGIKPDTVYQG